MYKLKNHRKNILKIGLCSLVIMLFISVSFGLQIDITPLNFLDRRVDSVSSSIEQNKSKGSAIVNNLYNNSLKQVDLLKTQPMLESVKNTTVALNDDFLCNINDNDSINILYRSNNDFKKQLKGISTDFQKPTKDDMVKSCEKLINCVFGDDGKSIVNSITYCQMIVNDYYMNEYSNTINISSLPNGSKGGDAFWNKTLDDSSYDILNDIYVLAKILFDTPQEPAEVLFYDTPDIAHIDSLSDPYLGFQKDWYSPYYVPYTGNGSSGQSGNSNMGNTGGGGDTPIGLQVFGDIDTEFQEFSNTITHNVEGSDGYEFLGNDCIDPFIIPGNSGYSYTEILTGYVPQMILIDEIVEHINSLSCNHNGVCEDSRESTTCDDCVEHDGGDTHPQDIGAIVPNLIEIYSGNEKIIQCFQSCGDVPCTATNCDKLACYAKCLCLSYETPFFNPIKDNGLGPVFRLKFCIKPVQDHKVVTTKKVNNLESVIKEINIVIQNLRNSGQMTVSEKSKEFMSASFKNARTNTLSFSLNTITKIPNPIGSEKQKREEQINFNTMLMKDVLGFDENESVDGVGRNKYVVKGGASAEGSINVSQQGVSQSINYQQIDLDVVTPLQSEKLLSMKNELGEFLESNRDFWQIFKNFMQTINGTAMSLLEKK